MRHPAAAALVLSLAVIPASCVLSPLSDTALGGTSVSFQGIALAGSGTSVQIQYQKPDLTWATLGTATVDDEGFWSASPAVPKTAWWIRPCAYARFRFRGPGNETLRARDAPCVRSLTPASTQAERNACWVTTLYLFQGQTHTGDLTISGQAEADARYCVTKVEGDLAVDGGSVAAPGPPGLYEPGLTFALPNLEQVTGSLSVDGNHTVGLSLPALESVGGDLSVVSRRFRTVTFPMGDPVYHRDVNAFDVPNLASVGGAVDLEVVNDYGPTPGNNTHDFGLDAVTSVGTDVSMHGPFLTTFEGLRGLVTIPRDLLFDWGGSDMDSFQFLSALETVGRDAILTLPPNARHGLHAVTHVGRHLVIGADASFTGLKDDVLPALTTVDGDLSLVDVRSDCGPARLAALETVAGTLFVQGEAPEAPMGATGGPHLVLGGLSVESTTSEWIPLQPDVEVLGAGPVSFTGNDGLCPCQITAFTDALAAGGWSGVPVAGGNGAAASCTVCPEVTCP